MTDVPNMFMYTSGVSLSEPHINGYCNARSVYMYVYIMVRPSPARRFIHSVLRPYAMFWSEKSAWSK